MESTASLMGIFVLLIVALVGGAVVLHSLVDGLHSAVAAFAGLIGGLGVQVGVNILSGATKPIYALTYPLLLSLALVVMYLRRNRFWMAMTAGLFMAVPATLNLSVTTLLEPPVRANWQSLLVVSTLPAMLLSPVIAALLVREVWRNF